MSAAKGLRTGAARAGVLVVAGMLLASCAQSDDQPVAEPTAVLTEMSTVETTAEKQPGETTQESSSSSAMVETKTETVTQQPPKSGVASSGCGTMSADQALKSNIGKVRSAGYPWSTDYAYTEGYDQCAALSWIIVTIEGATGSSPNHIMLFNEGDYLGTATYEAYGFTPNVSRVSDDTINVVYRYVLPGESNAEASGRAYATFQWDEDAEEVTMYGDVPPT